MLLAVSNETELRNRFAGLFAAALPRNWRVETMGPSKPQGPDAWLAVTPPAGCEQRFAIEMKSRFEPRDLDYLARQTASWNIKGPIVLVTPHLSERSRELLAEHGFSYADLAGNMRLSGDTVFIERTGREPKRTVRTRIVAASLRGPLTGRVVRYVCEAIPPLGVRQIASGTNAPPGNVSRILRYLEKERFVHLDDRRRIATVDWEPLLRSWGQELGRTRVVRSFLEPRGISAVLKRLAGTETTYSLTGSFAASQIVPVALASAIDIYAEDIDELASRINANIPDEMGNVRLIQAYDDVVFQRTISRNGLILANPVQIAADLRTLPSRSEDEYSELIIWMKEHEGLWRVA